MFIPCYADRWNLPHIYQPTYHTGDTPVNTVYSVSAAADVLNVSVSTVRRTCADFAGYLPDYQPAPGQTRTLSTADVLTISAILTRLQARPGLTRSALLAELSTGQGEPLIVPAELPTRQPQNAPDSPRAPIASTVVSDSPAQSHAAIQALSTIAADVARLHARIDGIQAQPAPASPTRAPDNVQLLSAAVAVGVLIGALVAAAVWDNSAAVVVCVAVALIAVLVSIIAPLRR